MSHHYIDSHQLQNQSQYNLCFYYRKHNNWMHSSCTFVRIYMGSAWHYSGTYSYICHRNKLALG